MRRVCAPVNRKQAERTDSAPARGDQNVSTAVIIAYRSCSARRGDRYRAPGASLGPTLIQRRAAGKGVI